MAQRIRARNMVIGRQRSQALSASASHHHRIDVNPTISESTMAATAVLFDWLSVLDNLCLALEAQGLPRAAARSIAERSLSHEGLQEWSGHYPFELSNGLQQRVAQCRNRVLSEPAVRVVNARRVAKHGPIHRS